MPFLRSLSAFNFLVRDNGPDRTGAHSLPVPMVWRRLMWIALFYVFALTVIGLSFAPMSIQRCSEVASWKFCRFSLDIVQRALAVIVLTGIALLSRPDLFAPVKAALAAPRSFKPMLLLAGLGALLAAVPMAYHTAFPAPGLLMVSLISWSVGVALLCYVALHLIAPLPVWGRVLKQAGPGLWVVLVFGLSLPELGRMVFPLWHSDLFKTLTFDTVAWSASAFGFDLQSNPAEALLGTDVFVIKIDERCSGIEGLALITTFLLGYVVLFWRHLLPARVLLVVLPVGLFLSWWLNTVRIMVLIWIGLNVSPDLAVGAFHSHAGWLMFSILAIFLVLVVHRVSWFQRPAGPDASAVVSQSSAPGLAPTPAPTLPAFWDDWNAARILPFAVFMFSALLASTFSQTPALIYPARFVLVAMSLWVFRAHLKQMLWRVDPLSVAAGGVIGVLWLMTATTGAYGPLTAALQTLAPGLLVLWVVTRVLGTTVLVPVVEELFFRSYLLEKLGAARSVAGAVLAICVSTVAFALLHDRWIAAGLAGLVFAALVLRPSGRLCDAIVAHVTANGVIAAFAVFMQDWGVI